MVHPPPHVPLAIFAGWLSSTTPRVVQMMRNASPNTKRINISPPSLYLTNPVFLSHSKSEIWWVRYQGRKQRSASSLPAWVTVRGAGEATSASGRWSRRLYVSSAGWTRGELSETLWTWTQNIGMSCVPLKANFKSIGKIQGKVGRRRTHECIGQIVGGAVGAKNTAALMLLPDLCHDVQLHQSPRFSVLRSVHPESALEALLHLYFLLVFSWRHTPPLQTMKSADRER